MIEKMVCSSFVGRAVRVVLNFVLAKLLLVPALDQVPGLRGFLENQDFRAWAVAGLAAVLCALAKSSRSSGKAPKWLPL